MAPEQYRAAYSFLAAEAGHPQVLENIAVPGWHALKKPGLLFIFLLLAVGAATWAYLLQQVAFPQAGSSGEQISATVYVETLPAHVNLQSMFTPSAATNKLSFTVTVTGPTKRPDPWLLVVQCAAPLGKAYPGAVPLWSESPTGRQSTGTVLVRPGPTKNPSISPASPDWQGMTKRQQQLSKTGISTCPCLFLSRIQLGSQHRQTRPCTPRQEPGSQNVVEVQAVPGAPCPISTPSPSSASPSAGSSSLSADTPSPLSADFAGRQVHQVQLPGTVNHNKQRDAIQ